jgi:hypothetical protein
MGMHRNGIDKSRWFLRAVPNKANAAIAEQDKHVSMDNPSSSENLDFQCKQTSAGLTDEGVALARR